MTLSSSPNISFNVNSDSYFRSVNVRIETDRLSIRSVNAADKEFYQNLFGDTNVMERFSDGCPRTPGNIAARINDWIDRWCKGNPFSALAIFKKEGDIEENRIGHIVLGYGADTGEAELVYLLKTEELEYEAEILQVVVNDYAKMLSDKEFKQLYGGCLQRIKTVVRSSNIHSQNALKEAGMLVSQQQGRNANFIRYEKTVT